MSESAEAKCNPFLQILEPLVKDFLADTEGWKAEDWDEDSFHGFFSEIAVWLKNEKKEKTRIVAKSVAGLMTYGAITEEKLQLAGRGGYDKFTEELSAKGIPKAICDVLFEKFVANREKRNASVDVVVAEVFAEVLNEETEFNLELGLFRSFSKSFPRLENRREVPRMVAVDKPYMLMFDIQNSSPPPELLDHVRKTAKFGPSCLYGTSGCGKTRSVLECLCQDYGMYFASDASSWNRGSNDFKSIVEEIKVRISNEPGKDRDDVAQDCLTVMMYSRFVVFKRISELLGELPSKYEWMLIQVHPEYCLGSDVFETLSRALLKQCRLSDVGPLYQSVARRSLPFFCFVDEAQLLLKISENEFTSQIKNGKMIRSMYSAVLRGLSALAAFGNPINGLLYPVFAGTDMSKEIFSETLGSFAEKEGQNLCNSVFRNFQAFTTTDVIEYIGNFASIPEGESAVARDCVERLNGQPRMTAIFSSDWMRGICCKTEVSGNFNASSYSGVLKAKTLENSVACISPCFNTTIFTAESKETLVLIHGAHDTKASYEKVAKTFAPHFDIYFYETKRIGGGIQSAPVENSPAFRAWVDDLKAFLTENKIERAHFIGHSFGARLALAFCGEEEEKVLSFLIEDMDFIPRPGAYRSEDPFQYPSATFDLTEFQEKLAVLDASKKFPILLLEADDPEGRAVTVDGERSLRTFQNRYGDLFEWEKITGASHNIHGSMTPDFLRESLLFYHRNGFLKGGSLEHFRIHAGLEEVDYTSLLDALMNPEKAAYPILVLLQEKILACSELQELGDLLLLIERKIAVSLAGSVERLESVRKIVENNAKKIVVKLYQSPNYWDALSGLAKRPVTQLEWVLVNRYSNPSFHKAEEYMEGGVSSLFGQSFCVYLPVENTSLAVFKRMFLAILNAYLLDTTAKFQEIRLPKKEEVASILSKVEETSLADISWDLDRSEGMPQPVGLKSAVPETELYDFLGLVEEVFYDPDTGMHQHFGFSFQNECFFPNLEEAEMVMPRKRDPNIGFRLAKGIGDH